MARATRKSLFTGSHILCYFLHVILCFQLTQTITKLNIDHSFRNCCQGRLILIGHCDVTQIRDTDIVTSSSPIVPTYANRRKADIHRWIFAMTRMITCFLTDTSSFLFLPTHRLTSGTDTASGKQQFWQLSGTQVTSFKMTQCTRNNQ